MVSKLEDSHSSDEDESDSDEAETKKKSDVYKPPMMSAAHYGKKLSEMCIDQ